MAVTAAILQSFNAFDNLAEEQLEEIIPFTSLKKFEKGAFVLKRGKAVEGVQYLVEGRIDLIDGNFNTESYESGDTRQRFPITDASPSPVAVKAKTDALVATIDREAFELVKHWQSEVPTLQYSNEMGKEDWMASLLEAPLFSQIPPTTLQQLFSCFEPVEMQAGEYIVRESEQGDYFYVLESGIAVVSTKQDGVVATLTAGKYFGEEALVGETVRNASVFMETNGLVMRLNKDDFKKLLQEPLLRYVSGTELSKSSTGGEEYQLIDVRFPVEFRKLHVQDSVNIPLPLLREKLTQLNSGKHYVITDDGGKRSEVAAHLMCQAGLKTSILQNAVKHYLL